MVISRSLCVNINNLGNIKCDMKRIGGFYMKKNKVSLSKILSALGVVALLASAIYLILKYNLNNIIKGIIRLEGNEGEVIKEKSKDKIFLITKPEDEDIKIENYLRKYDWDFLEQYGRGHIYEKNGEEILVKKRKFFGEYYIYEIINDIL